MNSSRVVRMKRVERKFEKNVTKEEYLMMKITYSVDGKLQSNCHHKFGNKLTHLKGTGKVVLRQTAV